MTKSDMIRARIGDELRKKIDADMERMGIANESDYIRMMLSGESGEIACLSEIKEQLQRIEDKLDAK